MKSFVLYKISFDRAIERSTFPFKLRREARPRPIRVCVRFELTQMSYWLGFINGAKT